MNHTLPAGVVLELFGQDYITQECPDDYLCHGCAFEDDKNQSSSHCGRIPDAVGFCSTAHMVNFKLLATPRRRKVFL